MKVTGNITSTQTNASVISLPVYRPAYVKDVVAIVPSTTNPIAFAFAIINEVGDPVFFTTGLYPGGSNVIKTDTVAHPGYSLWIKPESAPGNDITVDFTLSISEKDWV